jgi:hypothetical protein
MGLYTTKVYYPSPNRRKSQPIQSIQQIQPIQAQQQSNFSNTNIGLPKRGLALF